ncbi:hypothetical protein [Lutibacter sp. HS1-25]|uniref:hypothetical protein n=1 Tax=Lutibacter sp. HS1-25 TaxID=2485000 RepID=UPI0010127EB3|nr:hypothetical protein [Lutibacter sp. HS1-25]
MTDGLIIGIIASLFLYPVQTDFAEYQNKNFKIYEKHKGFLDGCCTYLITEKQLIIFEKKIKEININQKIDLEKSKLTNENGILKLKYQYEDYDYKLERTIKVDSTIVIRPKKLL